MYKRYISKQKAVAIIFMISFSLLTTFLALSSLSIIGLGDLLPTQQSLILAIIIAMGLGFIKSKTITKVNISYKKAFLIGMGLFLVILPLFDIGAIFMMQNQFHGTSTFTTKWSEYFTLYLFIVIYSFIFVGSWLSVISGFIFMAFNKFFSQTLSNTISVE